MRALVLALLITSLAQPALALQIQVGNLYAYCVNWQRDGYSAEFKTNVDGLNSAFCAAYMSAMSDKGVENCFRLKVDADGKKFVRGWKATKEQLAAAFIKETESYPDALKLLPSGFISTFAPQMFPCDQ